MIKFFRRIREQLLSANKFSKYLIYAIGEIVLVVIGILIALQINNWNERRNTRALAKNYLTDIKRDLKTDTLTFHAAIERIGKTISKNELLLNPKYLESISTDSILSFLETSFHSTRIYHIDNATYLKLSNTGFLEAGIFDAVFTDINNYYNKEYVAYSEYIEWDEDQSIDLYHWDFLGIYKNEIDLPSLFMEDGIISDHEIIEKNRLSFWKFINSSQFRNATWANYNRKKAVLDRLMLQKQIADDLIEKIDSKLKAS